MRDVWWAVCRSRDLRQRPHAVTVDGQPLVVWRSPAGVSALEDRCPHRNVALSQGRLVNGCLACPYHGWEFSASGRCTRVPGLARPPEVSAPAYPACEEQGLVWVCLGTPRQPPYRVPLPDYRTWIWSLEARGSLANVAENFLDATHTHFVHAGVVRAEGNRQRVLSTIRRSGDRIEVEYAGEERPSGWLSRLFEGRRSRSFGRFIWPNVAQIEYRNDRGTTFLVTAYLTPTRPGHLRAQAVLSAPPGWWWAGLAGPFLRHVWKQDARMLARQAFNLGRFGEERFHYTAADLIRPHMEHLLARGPSTETFPEKEVELWL